MDSNCLKIKSASKRDTARPLYFDCPERGAKGVTRNRPRELLDAKRCLEVRWTVALRARFVLEGRGEVIMRSMVISVLLYCLTNMCFFVFFGRERGKKIRVFCTECDTFEKYEICSD